MLSCVSERKGISQMKWSFPNMLGKPSTPTATQADRDLFAKTMRKLHRMTMLESRQYAHKRCRYWAWLQQRAVARCGWPLDLAVLDALEDAQPNRRRAKLAVELRTVLNSPFASVQKP